MPSHEPFPISINTPVDIEPSNLSSCSLSELLIGALSQVATTVELTNRVYDRCMAQLDKHMIVPFPLEPNPLSRKGV
jgi:hypothetical protein